MPKEIICKYPSLNANGLNKTIQSSTPSHLLRFIRLQQFSILCFQETRAKTQEMINGLNIRLQPIQSFWTPRVGIVSFSLDFHITIIDTSNHFSTDRIQLCKITHPNNFYDPFYVLNIYAPVAPAPRQRDFYAKLYQLLHEFRGQISFDHLIISGDFNYSH